MSVAGGTVLLTGATGGLGQAIARAFAERGASLLLSGRRGDVLEALAEEVGGRAIPCDLSDREEVRRLAREADGVDILVANAALPAVGLVTELTDDDIDLMLDVNLRAPLTLARALAPGMIGRRRGHMVFMCSLAGKVASPASAMYSATKFGLRGFALGLRQDLRPHGIGVSLVFPGFIREAGMFAEANVELPRGVGTRSPANVATAVIDAIDRNRAEVHVAPVSLRVGAALAGVVPGMAADVTRAMGGERIAADFAAAQSGRR